jgi:YebC/PmpR family DNA-binding regulatory protein
MWRWPTVAGQKEASAKAKSKIYNIHSKLITIASEKWSDPSINSALADAISSAKREGVTSDVIERAVRRWAGIDKDASKVEEVYYEWYAPGGVAVIVRALTDNRNRTAPSMRHIFSSFGGSLGETGSVSGFAFEFGGTIVVEKPADVEEFEMMILSTDAIDYLIEENTIRIKTTREWLRSTLEAIKQAGYPIVSDWLGYTPKNYTEVTDFDKALQIYKMLEGFEADEDVEIVWNTADISDTLWKEVTEFVEKKKFRT